MKNKKSNFINRLVVKDTKKYGKGVFTLTDIKKGTIIYKLDGEKLSLAAVLSRLISGKESIDDIFQIGKRSYIDLDEFSRTFNHSCNPNTGVRKAGEMFSLRNIKAGEEITYDYSLTVAPTVWRMKSRCKCGSVNCRKVVSDILSIPPKRLEEYKKIANLQRYIKLLLNDVEKNGSYEMPKYEKLALEKLKKNGVKLI